MISCRCCEQEPRAFPEAPYQNLRLARRQRLDNNLIGIAVHTGVRVTAKAGPGEVLVSGTVKDLVVGSEIKFTDKGVHQLKGVPEDCHLYLARVDD